jgi:uncharacterized protein YkwD
MFDADTARGLRAARRVSPRLIFGFVVTGLVAWALASTAPASAHMRGQCRHADTPIARATHRQLGRAVVCLVNWQRRRFGLPRLRENSRLDHSAQRWTNFMVAHRDFSHGSNFAGRITAAGFDWSSAGENIASGFSTAFSVVGAWMHSAGHCRNILSPTFRNIGVGVNSGGAARYMHGTWTEDFGLWSGAQPPSDNSGPADGCPH